MPTRFCILVLVPSWLLLALGGCAGTNWERSLYEGVRQGADNAARQPAGRAVPQAAPLPRYDDYEREREALRGMAPADTPVRAEAAASATAR